VSAGHFKKAVVLLLVGIAATLLAAVAAGMGAGACHCSTPPTVLFPFAIILTASDSAATVALTCQFPLYAFALGFARGELWKAGVAALLFVLHVSAVLVGLAHFQH
jgi:hypothetical protein